MSEAPGDTIYAPATAAGRAAIAILRVSGPGSPDAIRALTGREPPKPRVAALRRIVDPADGGALDEGLVLWFPAPASESGEDMAEFHLHGGRAVIEGAMRALARLPGLRLARPGEFTRRAFANDKLDLTQAEAIADLVEAETAAQARQAMRQMQGELGRLYEAWRVRLMRALAHAEAEIDFPDEDLPQGMIPSLRPDLTRLAEEIAAHLADGRCGERLRHGLQIAIIGPANAGKSSLLNALARRDAAIVSTLAGTTRDVVEVALDLGGFPVVLADTAGLRELPEAGLGGHEAIEREGIGRALARAAEADLKLVVLDAGGPCPDAAILGLIDADAWIVANKIDLSGGRLPQGLPERPLHPVSVKTGDGMPALIEALSSEAARRLGSGDAGPPLTRARHREALGECLACLDRALSDEAASAELFAEDLRLAARGLGRITGRTQVDDVLDLVFAEFCIGK